MVEGKMTKSQILNYKTDIKSIQPIKPIAMNGIREIFELKKKDFSTVNEAWEDWQNQYADDATVTTKN